MSMIKNEAQVVEERADGSRRVGIVCGGGRTKQSMAKECDINRIMARFQKTGALTHFRKFEGEYGFAPAVSFHESMDIVLKAQQMFNELPGKVRARFGNDPGEFLAFVQDEGNADEMVSLGLREPRTPSEIEALGDRLVAALQPEAPADAPAAGGTGST